MAQDNEEISKKYGIGAVARVTGLSTHVLRMWERRYQVVDAERAANGRRYYRPDDVEKLSLLKILTDQGASIGSIANLALQDLRDRIGEVQDMTLTRRGADLKVRRGRRLHRIHSQC